MIFILGDGCKVIGIIVVFKGVCRWRQIGFTERETGLFLGLVLLDAELLLSLARGGGAADGDLAEVVVGNVDLDHPIEELLGDLAPSMGMDGRDELEEHTMNGGMGGGIEEVTLDGIDDAEGEVEVVGGEVGVGAGEEVQEVDA
ncbi:uncharacterized protein [Elaeis guineensis]|uniref:uncharacterized protein n=1 Tax=Elaeis guineensis var. tenera TaxID=51953 RepID=UPI003C6D44AF